MNQVYTYTLGHFQKTVAAAATPEVLSSAIQARGVKIKALTTNTGLVFVGNSAAMTASTGYPLSAGQELRLSDLGLTDLSKVFIRVAANGEGVACVYEV